MCVDLQEDLHSTWIVGFSSQTMAGLTQRLWAGPAEAPLWLMVEAGYFGGKSGADPSLPHQNHKTYPEVPFVHKLRGGCCVSSAGPRGEVVFVLKELTAGEEAQTWAFPKNLRSE